MADDLNGQHLIDVHKYVEKRSAQVSELLQVVDNRNLVSGEVTKGPRTAAQRLPRHMRRRAMAYEIKRFPRGIRSFALSVAVPSKHRKKPPCRYFRRRSRNLLLNYIRRQKRAVWLETHIWHAKRFHMVDRWGYRLPDRSFQRNFRPCYRDSVRHCSVRDKSFLNCLVINTSDRASLINLLKPLCNQKVSPTFAFQSGLSGRYEVNALIYEANQYPKGFIGPIRFLWSTTSDGHALTIWTHPSTRERLISVLSSILSLKRVICDSTTEESCPQSVDDWRLASMKIRTDIYESEDTSIKLFDLRDQMVRFRLYGPLSMTILANSVRLIDDEDSYSESHIQWQEHFSKINIGEVRDSTVFSLLIEDPRINRVGSSKKVPWPEPCDLDPEEHCVPVGNLWDRSVRLQALEKKLSDAELKKLMGSCVGTVSSTGCKIPIVIVARNNGDGHASPLTGLEVIAPAGFGPGLWISLQMNTARASGIRDDLAAHLESSRYHYPTDAVDSCSGSAELLRIRKECEERHSKRPHNRRVDYWKAMSVKHPFAFEFKELLNDWKTYLNPSSSCAEEVYVLRDRIALRSIDDWFKGKGRKPDDVLNDNEDALIPIRVELTSRGKPRKFGLICLPTPTDMIKNVNSARIPIVQPPRGLAEESSPAEVVNTLPNKRDDDFWKDIVSVDYSEHETPISLKSLFPDSSIERSLKRKILNRTKRENKKRRKIDREERLRSLNEDVKEMESTSYREAANRLTVGRIVRGDYSFKYGKGVALGYVPIVVLQQIMSTNGKVLLRNSTSKYYHLGKVEVLKNGIEI